MTAENRLPHNIEAECGVLGSIIIDPEALSLVADVLRPADFYRNTHRTLYEAIVQLTERHAPADFITICDELERQGTLEEVGGASYITSLISGVPTSGNIEHYARIVERTAILRRLIHAAGQIAAVAYEDGDAEVALEQAEQAIFAIGHEQRHTDLVPISEALSDYMRDLDQRHTEQGTIIGVPTGMHDLDCALGGLQRSDLLILAARPGQGKTSLALNIARHAVYQADKHVAFFSLEMGRSQLVQRLLAMEAHMDQHRLRMGWLHDEEWEQVIASFSALTTGGLWIDDTAGISIATLRSKARRLHAQVGLDLVIVDYLQLAQATLAGKRYQNREQEIAEISRSLKGLAKDLDVPVLALAQLSRAVENRASKIPQLSDLRESGSLENDADVVLFIFREETQAPEGDTPAHPLVSQTADLIIAKHRNGPVGFVKLAWNAQQTRFANLDAKVSPSV